MTLLAFIFVLGVLVYVHELGHFLVARWYGVRVITFSLGFGPKLLKYRRGDTEYCVSAIPLGGYVKLAGETVDQPLSGTPDEFLSKSKWVRFQVYLAGPVMNLALAVVVLAFVLMGGADVPLSGSAPPIVGSVASGSAAEEAGLRHGDRIVSVNGRPVPTWDALDMEVLPAANRALRFVVERAGQPLELLVTPRAEGRYEIGQLGVRPIERPQIVEVYPNTAAARAGFRRGDVIVGLDGDTGLAQPEVIDRIRTSGGRTMVFAIERDGRPVEMSAQPVREGDRAVLGVVISAFEVRRVDPSVFEALKMSVEQNWATTMVIGRTLKGLFTRETPVRQLMGPVAIAELSGSAAELGWQALFGLMAMISLNLGLLNLLPVPVLDGGHIMILAVEGLARRDLSIRVKERILMAGAAVIVFLMVTVIYNDIARLLR